MSSLCLPYDKLYDFTAEIFLKLSFSKEDSDIITDVLLLSDLFGIESHGVQRLYRYYRDIGLGLIDKDGKPEVVFETPVSAVIDGNRGMGQIIAHLSMKKAIEKARSSGIGLVSVRNSNHYGIAGYYAKMACDEGLIGLSMTNSAAIMVPTFGSRAMLGSNPLAAAVPAQPHMFLFDASTTVVTRGKLEVYGKNEQEMPEGWAVNSSGKDTADAGEVLKNIADKEGGGILPLGGSSEENGGHKGYGFGMLAEIFCAAMSLGTFSNRSYENGVCGVCHCFAVIDPGIFGDGEQIKTHFSGYLEELRKSAKAEGQSRIYIHGEKEIENADRIRKEGVPVNIKTAREMREAAEFAGVDFEGYFGGIIK